VTTKEVSLKTEIISATALRITAPEKLKADDFRQMLGNRTSSAKSSAAKVNAVA